jgi:hypothetical protein
VAAAHSFDPQDPSRQGENEDRAWAAIDGNPATKWETEGYRNRPDFGGLKSGLGLILDLGRSRPARTLELQLSNPGATVSIYAAGGSRPPATLDAGWRRLTEPKAIDDERHTFALGGQDAYRFYLIWFTRLPSDGEGTYRGGIVEATLKS